MGTGYNHSIRAIVQGLTPWNSICHNGFCAFHDLLFSVLLVALLSGVLLWSEGDQWVCWFWILLGGTSWQIYVRHCLWWAQYTSEELQSNLQLWLPVLRLDVMGGALQPSSASTSSGPRAGSAQKDSARLLAVWNRLDKVTMVPKPISCSEAT